MKTRRTASWAGPFVAVCVGWLVVGLPVLACSLGWLLR